MKTKAGFGLLLVCVLLFGTLFVRPAAQVSADGLTILKFGTMVGVPLPYTGTLAPIRGINGGGLPWVVLGGADGKLTASGKLNVSVTGLVLDPNDPTVISRNLAGVNPISTFRAVVSCQTIENGVATVKNIMTDPFPATTGPASAGGGNAAVETFVNLPHPCIAPIIFVTSPGGAWFATTGY